MRAILVMLTLWSGALQAQEWAPLTGAEITTLLTDTSVTYGDARQLFMASGRTLYNAGRDSWGYWSVRGDQYCSQWPPSDRWDCYDMAREGDKIRFVDGFGNVTEGQIAQ